MIDAIRQFFTEQLGTDDSGVHPDHELRLAASALLFEAALSDYDGLDISIFGIRPSVCTQSVSANRGALVSDTLRAQQLAHCGIAAA